MGIRSIDLWKKNKENGAKLGREEIVKRVLRCVEAMQKDTHYQGVIEFVGRMKAIAQVCDYDSYWSEKVHRGYHSEKEDIDCLVKTGRNRYYGYCGKDLMKEEFNV